MSIYSSEQLHQTDGGNQGTFISIAGFHREFIAWSDSVRPGKDHLAFDDWRGSPWVWCLARLTLSLIPGRAHWCLTTLTLSLKWGSPWVWREGPRSHGGAGRGSGWGASGSRCLAPCRWSPCSSAATTFSFIRFSLIYGRLMYQLFSTRTTHRRLCVKIALLHENNRKGWKGSPKIMLRLCNWRKIIWQWKQYLFKVLQLR